jgi:hypothetical protein
LTFDELKNECIKRKLAFSFDMDVEQLIKLLKDDDNKPPDWGKIYSRVLYHTGMHYEEIARRTIPQITAILDGAGENISIKLGLPMGDSQSPTTPQTDEPPKVSQFAAMANMFSGI